MTTISDETLMALADGELDPAEAARVRAAIAGDPELAELFAGFAETRALLAADRAGADEPLPADLLAAVTRAVASADAGAPRPPAPPRLVVIDGDRPAPPLANPAAAIAPRRPSRVQPLLLAASLAFACGGVLGYSLNATRDAVGTELGDIAAGDTGPLRAGITAALAGLASGETRPLADGAAAIRVVSTHRLGDGGACREYLLGFGGAVSASQLRIACRTDGAWRTRFAMSVPAEGGFTPAGAWQAAADEFLAAAGSREAVTGAAERDLLGR